MPIRPKLIWYREPWPWILIFLPLSAVVASFITIWLAVSSADGLVEDDYYKQGIGINKTLQRDQVAQALALNATMSLSDDGKTLSVKLSGKLPNMPETLALSMVHPTQSGRDLHLNLSGGAEGIYSTAFPGASKNHWRLILESPAGDWRLTGLWKGGNNPVAMGTNSQVRVN